MCHLLSSEGGESGFTIQVPIDSGSSNGQLTATIVCQISNHSHRLTLQGLHDSNGRHVTLSGEENEKLGAVLTKVERNRLCGNAKICPQRIVQLVAELHKQMND